MNTKKHLVSFVAIVSLLFLVATVSASGYDIELVTVDGVPAMTDGISVVAGETVEVKVWFEALEDDTEVTLEIEVEGENNERYILRKNNSH